MRIGRIKIDDYGGSITISQLSSSMVAESMGGDSANRVIKVTASTLLTYGNMT